MALSDNYMQYDPLVTAAQVISNAFTNQNTDPTLISDNIIVIAEVAHIKDALGFDFYLHLKEAFDSTGTGTADEETFFDDYLKQTLSWFVRFEVINEIQMNSTSSGIVTAIPEFATAVDAKTLNVYKQDTYRKGKLLMDACIKLLDDNASDFPEYNSTTSVDCKTGKRSGVIKTHGMIIY